MKTEMRPFKSMGNPDAGLFSPGSDIALMDVLLNFPVDDVKVRLKCCPDDIWQALDNLAKEAPRESIVTCAAPPLKNLCAEKREGFAAAICKPEAAVAAIFKCVTLKEKIDNLCNR